jgi:hypothetical protein
MLLNGQAHRSSAAGRFNPITLLIASAWSFAADSSISSSIASSSPAIKRMVCVLSFVIDQPLDVRQIFWIDCEGCQVFPSIVLPSDKVDVYLSLQPLALSHSPPHLRMAAVSNTIESFSTFHSTTTATLHIIEYASADTLLLPMGGGVNMRRAYHPVASGSQALRELYLSQPYPTTAEDRTTAPIRCSIGEALYFYDLQTLASFFREGPGRNAIYFLRIRCIIVSYLDDQAVGWWPGTNDFAYEAFELLY